MANNNCKKMNFVENSGYSSVMNPSCMNKFRRAISNQPGVPVKRKRFTSDPAVIFFPIDDVIIEADENSSDNHSSFDDTVASQHGEVRIALEEASTTPFTMKMHPVEA